jgi:signal transduction histidine kinase
VDDVALSQVPWPPDRSGGRGGKPRPDRAEGRDGGPRPDRAESRDGEPQPDRSAGHDDGPGPAAGADEPDWPWDGRRDHPRGPWRRRPHPNWPGGVVLAAALIQVLGARSAVGDGGLLRPLTPWLYAILLAGPIALYWRRRYPVTVLLVASAASIVFATGAVPRSVFAAAPVIALFTLARAGRVRAALLTAGAVFTAYVLICWVFGAELGVAEPARPDLRTTVLLGAGLGLTIVLGGAAKARAEHLAEMIKVRAERARAREEQERRQASEERLRIARELHDVLGHHLSLINVQAGVGLHLMDKTPEQAREALTAIKTASAEALREVRAVLGVLRTEDEAAPRQPALGLDRLGELTADAGLPVTTTVSGERRPLPAEVDRAAYRIVQEALTNVRRHAAGGTPAEITVEYGDRVLRLSVRNAGPAGSGPAGGGSGIAGMRARAESLGGTLTAGAAPDGGFQVVATLPVPALETTDPEENA